jgi:21S rRNA (uridine2791-2'-O)-methyltransferase
LEKELKKMFRTVHREKPESSRSVGWPFKVEETFILTDTWQESKEAYFVALRRKVDVVEDASTSSTDETA